MMLEAAIALLTLLAFATGYGACWWCHAWPARMDANAAEALADLQANILRKQVRRLNKFERRKGPNGRFISSDALQ